MVSLRDTLDQCPGKLHLMLPRQFDNTVLIDQQQSVVI
jgi:hypothetical protein